MNVIHIEHTLTLRKWYDQKTSAAVLEEDEMKNALYYYVQHKNSTVGEAQHTGLPKRPLILVLFLKLKIFLLPNKFKVPVILFMIRCYILVSS